MSVNSVSRPVKKKTQTDGPRKESVENIFTYERKLQNEDLYNL
jgi:hypothetical protein